jgi:hypothetical protein
VDELKVEYLWVDAICINQADSHVERPQQLSLMGRIFESADEVLVWLGHYIRQVVDFHWSATSFLDVVKQVIDEMGPTYVHDRSILDPTLKSLLGREPSLIRLQTAMDFYGRCRVFSRTWILQEFAKAMKPRMFCGNIEIPTIELFQLGE